ncbi:EamA family transporter [bacterium]|jgi:drug/metabolite transporter (DMT)-like permease|nr:EamA family transporter [bacterium]
MTIPLDSLLCIVVTVVTFALYNIFIKQYSKRLILLFWVEIITYLGFTSIYLFQKVILEKDMTPFEELIYDFTYTNAPFYLLLAICFVGSLLLLDYLLKEFEISLIAPLSQISLLFIAVGNIVLGDPFSPIVMACVFIVFLGALVSSLNKITLPNPFAEFKNISPKLAIGVLQYSSLLTAIAMIAYQVTQITEQTKLIKEWATSIFKPLHAFPFHFYHPFYFNIGIRFFIMICFIFSFYVIEKRKFSEPFVALKEDFWFILKTGLTFFVSVYTYFYAYMNVADKNILGAMNKLAIPTILIFGYYLLNEKIKLPKVLGSALIVGGSLLVLFV